MGDRFYHQQQNTKTGRRLKKDIISDFESFLGTEVAGLDKLTIATLDDLIDKVKRKYYENTNS